jgi:hypothetical protein
LDRLAVEDIGDALVYSPPLRPEQAVVGGIADERVFERVGGLGRDTAPEDELCGNEPIQCAAQVELGMRGDGSEKRVVELATDASCDLCHLLCGTQAIEPRKEGAL